MRYTIISESDGERILKIGQHLPKLWARIKSPVFFYSRGMLHTEHDIDVSFLSVRLPVCPSPCGIIWYCS